MEGIEIPIDEEQKAANAGDVTFRQKMAGENMRVQVAEEVQKRLDRKLIESAASALRTESEERRRAALLAGEQDRKFIERMNQKPEVVKKRSWLGKIFGGGD